MTWDRILYLVVLGAALVGLYQFVKWADGNWGWSFLIPWGIACLGVAWIIDRRSKSGDSE